MGAGFHSLVHVSKSNYICSFLMNVINLKTKTPLQAKRSNKRASKRVSEAARLGGEKNEEKRSSGGVTSRAFLKTHVACYARYML